MQYDSTFFLKAVKYSALSVCGLMVAGIATLMYIAWDKDEDIAGIVASALFITIVSAIIAVAAAIVQRRMFAK
jgi:hypothetical protein